MSGRVAEKDGGFVVGDGKVEQCVNHSKHGLGLRAQQRTVVVVAQQWQWDSGATRQRE